MTTVQRYDFVDLKAHLDDDGFLHDSPIVGRIGIQEYRNADGSIRKELRLPDDVFHADAMATLAGKPITVDHPKSGKVTAKDAHRVTVGTMLDGKQDGDFVRAKIVIHSPDAIGDRRGLSLGYKADTIEEAGVWNGQEYTHVQKNIRINHLSVVRNPRAGMVARLNLDGDEEFFNQQEQQTMSTVKVKLDSGLEYDAAPEVSVELQKLRKDASDAAEQLKAVPKLEAERDTLKAKVDGFEAELTKARAEGKAEAEAKVKLDAVAASLKVDTKDKTPRQIKEAVIKAVTPKMTLDGKDDAYVDVAFDMAVEMKGDKAMQQQRIDANSHGDGNKTLTSTEKRDAMAARLKEKK